MFEERRGVEGYNRMARRKREIFEAEEVFVAGRAGGRRANIVIEEPVKRSTAKEHRTTALFG